MLWRALSRMIAVRLVLLVAIAAAGPAGLASSWHTSGSLEHRLSLPSVDAPAPSMDAGALPPIVASHCEACQFGATLRAWSPAAVTSSVVPASTERLPAVTDTAALRERPADANAGRAPPRVC